MWFDVYKLKHEYIDDSNKRAAQTQNFQTLCTIHDNQWNVSIHFECFCRLHFYISYNNSFVVGVVVGVSVKCVSTHQCATFI